MSYTRHAVKPGDRVTTIIHGRHYGTVDKVTFDGYVLTVTWDDGWICRQIMRRNVARLP